MCFLTSGHCLWLLRDCFEILSACAFDACFKYRNINCCPSDFGFVLPHYLFFIAYLECLPNQWTLDYGKSDQLTLFLYSIRSQSSVYSIECPSLYDPGGETIPSTETLSCIPLFNLQWLKLIKVRVTEEIFLENKILPGTQPFPVSAFHPVCDASY